MIVLVVLCLLLIPVAVEATEAEEAISLFAIDRQEWEGDVWRGEGGVRILYQDIKIECDRIEYDRKTMDLVASGHVVLDQGPRRFAADELKYNLRTKTGIFTNAEAQYPPSYHFAGKVIEKLDETHYRIEDVTFTSCEVDEGKPPWDFSIKSGLVEEEGYGRFKGAAIRIKHVPIFYLPYIVWPVKQERTMGMLMPRFGYSQNRGWYLGNSFYLPVGRSYDTTFDLDLYSERYVGIGNEWRWAPRADIFGQVYGYVVRDPNDGKWQWKLNGMHKQDNLWGFRLLARVEALSDDDFWQEYDRDFAQNTRRSLYSYVYLTRSWGPAALNIRSDRRTTFFDTDDVILNQIPEVELRVRATRLGLSDAYWSMISSVNYFDVDRGGDLKGSYGRADLFPSISYTLPGPAWLTVTPKVGGRATYWSARYSDDRTSFVDEPIDRTYLAAGVDIIGPSVSRVFNTPDRKTYVKYKHLIEPRIDYKYQSDEQDEWDLIPIFDEVDSTRATNRVGFVLANRLFGKTKEGLSARELVSFELSQFYSFSEPLTYGSGGESSQLSPFNASLRVTPTTGTTVDARASWDSVYKSLRSTSISGSVFSGGINTALTWYQGFVPATGDKSSSQIRLMAGFTRPQIPVKANINLSYDIVKKEFQQQQYQLSYKGSCWGIALDYRDLRIGLYPNREYRIVISLKDVGELPQIHGRLDSIGN